MRRYRITYRDADPGCPLFTWITRAYDEEHALRRFYESDDDPEGWIVVKIELDPKRQLTYDRDGRLVRDE